jgi:tyrosyl-tRNA synthetase
MKGLIETLRARGLIEAVTNDEIQFIVEKEKPIGVYCGVDPTADSLHLGHLMAFVALAWFRRYGHAPVVLVGGATGLIGDPSGKSVERVLLSDDVLASNVACLTKSLKTIFSRVPGSEEVRFVNNRDWFERMGCIELLRDIGRYFRVGTMISRESVKLRLASEEGLSYTEFSYQLLQGYDFYHLNKNFGVTLQIGGSDQWGNITAGIDFIRRMTGKEVYGLTFPLLVKSDGKKFGKSESGAVWLSEEKLSPYDFYQYLFRTTDADVIRLLKALTFLDLEEINELERSMALPSYIPNTAQRLLADEVTRLVHGEEGLASALRVTEHALPGKEKGSLSVEALLEMKGHVPTASLSRTAVVGARVCDVLAAGAFCSSRTEARKLIANGGVRVGERKIEDELDVIIGDDLIDGRFLLFALGKKKRAIVEIHQE